MSPDQTVVNNFLLKLTYHQHRCHYHCLLLLLFKVLPCIMLCHSLNIENRVSNTTKFNTTISCGIISDPLNKTQYIINGECISIDECHEWFKNAPYLSSVVIIKCIEVDTNNDGTTSINRSTLENVCCPIINRAFSDYHNGIKTINQRKKRALTYISDNNVNFIDCGSQSENRILGGEIAFLEEFTWMALLIYETSRYRCGGTLINERYVLTAAHCIIEPDEKLKFVRLGEYIIDSDDCVFKPDNSSVCADPPIDFDIEKVIIHSNYSLTSRQNDIALIRLNRNVEYSESIHPICLPMADFNSGLYRGNYNLTVAGWGWSDIQNWNRLSPFKIKVQVPYVDREYCQKVLGVFNVKLNDGQFCAGSVMGKDSCRGDSGGAVMNFDKNRSRWVVTGIVSFGLKKCGLAGVPSVNTRVDYYIDWIVNVIKKSYGIINEQEDEMYLC